MNDNKYELVLALLIINKGEPLNNSYKLMRILEWWFRVINSKEILDDIKQKKYAEFDLVNGIHYYNLTLLGREFIKKEYELTLTFLLHNHPERADMINALFESFSNVDN